MRDASISSHVFQCNASRLFCVGQSRYAKLSAPNGSTRSLAQACMTAYCILHNTYDPGISLGSANQCILGDVHLISYLSKEKGQRASRTQDRESTTPSEYFSKIVRRMELFWQYPLSYRLLTIVLKLDSCDKTTCFEVTMIAVY